MKLGSIMIGTADPARLAGYYTALFGTPEWDDGSGFFGWDLGEGTGLGLGPHDEVSGSNVSPGRVMWNLESLDFQAEYDRLAAAGAIVVKEPYDPTGNGSEMRIATFADPDGNYFQLMTPMAP